MATSQVQRIMDAWYRLVAKRLEADRLEQHLVNLGRWVEQWKESSAKLEVDMRVSETQESSFKAEDLDEEKLVLTISGAVWHNYADEGSKPDMKLKVFFEGTARYLVANRTNINMIVDNMKARGFKPSDETDLWVGQDITLYATTTPFKGAIVACIRVERD